LIERRVHRFQHVLSTRVLVHASSRPAPNLPTPLHLRESTGVAQMGVPVILMLRSEPHLVHTFFGPCERKRGRSLLGTSEDQPPAPQGRERPRHRGGEGRVLASAL